MSAQRARATVSYRPSPAARTRLTDAREVGLRLVSPVRSRARRAPFVVVVIGLLSAGLLGLIVMSTVLQAQSFEQAALTKEAASLETQQQALSREADRMNSPAALSSRARALGMVPNANPVFLRLSDGTVVGKPEPAKAGNPLGTNP